MPRRTHLLLLAGALGSLLGCSSTTGAGNACSEPTAQVSAKLETRCVGTAKSCSSFGGISTKTGQRACADQDGCYPDYDSMSCKGTATRCDKHSRSEVYCKGTVGCRWETGESASAGGSDGASSGGASSSGTPAQPCPPSGDAGVTSGSSGAPGSSGGEDDGGAVVTTPGSSGGSSSGGGTPTNPDAGGGGSSGGGTPTNPDAGGGSSGGAPPPPAPPA